MKTCHEIRRMRLSQLITEYGTAAALSEIIDKAPAQVSQWVNGTIDSKSGKPRQINDATARTLEKKLGKPVGWFDNQDPPESIAAQYRIESIPQDEALELLSSYAGLHPDDQVMAKGLITRLGELTTKSIQVAAKTAVKDATRRRKRNDSKAGSKTK